MLGNMMDTQLLIIDLLRHARDRHPSQAVVSRRLEGDIHRSDYAQIWQRSSQLAHALDALAVKPGDCIATLAWNTHRHMELYYAVSGIGAILHTVNPRLFSEQIDYIINHAEDKIVFVDLPFVKLLEPLQDKLTSVKAFVVMTDRAHMPDTSLAQLYCFEELIEAQPTDYDWPRFDENTAAALCYTSGTTGNPKGVLYSHRAMVLHAQATASRELLDLDTHTVLMPMVAMYHAGAWGAPYAAPLAGCKLVLPGAGMDGASMSELINSEGVTVGLGVPTIWLTLHNHWADNDVSNTTLERVCVGGAASPLGMVKLYQERYGIYWQPIWGMTETGPLATSLPPTADVMALPMAERYRQQTSAGRAAFGVEMALFDADDQRVCHDGTATGELRVRGPWISSQYYRNDDLSAFPDGWLATGDIAVIDPNGTLRVVDRKKDVIKSGGEWISSLEIENIVSQHPSVNECSVIGARHEKWDERPVLIVVPNKNTSMTHEDVVAFLDGKIARWWTPDQTIFITGLPKTGTGKVLKNELREQYGNVLVS
ncbi:long-chain fatty acid--CoA ligase [Pseudohongiella sp.]|uniref:AMP-dependent synthetase/ligase domain-containing protein n=1 Tax=marine sediment metagenome TaxID=412755 RepID=A0A0F9VK07_9ZZZZ|nr:long-chain fatty acid--CoA ligase [Pseudohongiella sp.]HDZ10353.1 fatty-acid--CoA ligase [Pseudohongiella sp.]HEA62024.1 fatty-acid--CoA ligase [Pseudohongiella sp.]